MPRTGNDQAAARTAAATRMCASALVLALFAAGCGLHPPRPSPIASTVALLPGVTATTVRALAATATMAPPASATSTLALTALAATPAASMTPDATRASATGSPTSRASPTGTGAPFDVLSAIQMGQNGAFTLELSDAQLEELARRDVADNIDPEVYNLHVAIKPDGVRMSARLVSLSRSMAIDATANGMLIVDKGQPRYDMTSSDVQIVCYLCRSFDTNGEPTVRVTPGAESVLSNEQMIADNRLRWKQFGQGMIQNALWSLSTDPRAKAGLFGRELRLERITLGDGEMKVEGRLQ